MQQLKTWSAASILIMGIFGCGASSDAPPLRPVQGLVTYQGKPVSNANVLFTPESGPISMGVTDSNGHFFLSTGTRTGATLGKHRVTITAFEPTPEIDSENERAVKPPVSRIPAQYGDLRMSGLTAEVGSQTSSEINFELR